MNSTYGLGINFDEISDSFEEAASLMSELDITKGELRTIRGKNFVFWTNDEIEAFRTAISESNIELVAAATPLFKWYTNPDDPEVPHDSFGFDPRLSYDQKKTVIRRAIKVASKLSIPRLRIFSELGTPESDAGENFAKNELLAYALDIADTHDIDLFIENEPVCTVHTKAAIIALLSANTHKRFKLWLDIANLLEVGETIDKEFIEKVAHRIGYLHVKDYVMSGGKKTYVPVGEGDINYPELFSIILPSCPSDTIVTIETHSHQDKVDASRKSLLYVKKLLDNPTKGERHV